MRIVFIGTGEIGVPTLRAIKKSEHDLVAVVTQPDKPVGREQKITAPPIKAALSGRSTSCQLTREVRCTIGLARLRRTRCLNRCACLPLRTRPEFHKTRLSQLTRRN